MSLEVVRPVLAPAEYDQGTIIFRSRFYSQLDFLLA
jgi:hypothetical protein